ncbi:MAG: cardiolipin synthase [Phycisphaerales bacterium JB040]
MLSEVPWAAVGSVTFHACVAVGLSMRVIARRTSTEVALSWIVLVVAFPVLGAVCYVLVGEPWLSSHRSVRRAGIARQVREPIAQLEGRFGHRALFEHPAARAVGALGHATGISPSLGGNRVEILADADAFFGRLIADIDEASTACDLLFYIWSGGGRVDDVADALVRASERGVACRVLVDAVGGRGLLRSEEGARLRRAGIELRTALPVGFVRGRFSRVDIRNHRKLAILDDRVAYTGSQNMADPRLFMRGSGVGPWVDLMARLEGPSAAQLGALFEIDWAMEDRDDVDVSGWLDGAAAVGDDVVQVVPSGPGQHPSALYRMLAAAVHGAQRRLIMTTPYFVPDDAFVSGLVSAAMRGVETTVVVPAKIDGPLVRLASRAYYDDLLDAGVSVLAYEGGLLHTKTVAVDDDLGIIGTVNLDRRSFWINYELSLVVHAGDAVRDLACVLQRYIEDSVPVCETDWMRRGPVTRFSENVARLFSPIL